MKAVIDNTSRGKRNYLCLPGLVLYTISAAFCGRSDERLSKAARLGKMEKGKIKGDLARSPDLALV